MIIERKSMKVLVIGPKEYPFRGRQKDIGGIDVYNENLTNELVKQLKI